MQEEKKEKTKKPLKPTVTLLYNGTDCTNDFSKYLNSIEFKEYEDEQSDELNLTLNNNDGYFSDLWYPKKGDKLTCSIIYGADIYECGTFTIDENNFDFSLSGDTVGVKALATSTNFSVRTQKVKNHTGKTLAQIASEIGKSYGFTVSGSEGDVKVGSIIQKNESDISFLRRLAKQYGFIFNIKDGFLTFINVEAAENQEPILSLSKTDIRNLSLTDTVTKIYGKCRVQYFDIKTKSLKTYTAVGNTEVSDTLNIYKRFNSIEEAKTFASTALKNSYREITGSIEPKIPHNYFMPGVNIDLTGIGRFEGKYHIRSQTRTVEPGGYKIKGEITKC